MFRKSAATFRNDPQCFVTLNYTLYWLQLAYTVGECILRRGTSNALFPNDFGEDLYDNGFVLISLVADPKLVTEVHNEAIDIW